MLLSATTCCFAADPKDEDIFTSPVDSALEDLQKQSERNTAYPVSPPVYANPQYQTQAPLVRETQPRLGFFGRLSQFFGLGARKIVSNAKLPIEQVPKVPLEEAKNPPINPNPIFRLPAALLYRETEIQPGIYALVIKGENPADAYFEIQREQLVVATIPATQTAGDVTSHSASLTAPTAKLNWHPQPIQMQPQNNLPVKNKRRKNRNQSELLAESPVEPVAVVQKPEPKLDIAQLEYQSGSSQAVLIYTQPSSGKTWKSVPLTLY